MKYKIKQGRPIDSRNVRVTPEFRNEPDIEKLGRALIFVAMSLAEKKKPRKALPRMIERGMA